MLVSSLLPRERRRNQDTNANLMSTRACLEPFDPRANTHSNSVGAMTSSHGSAQDLDGSDSDATTIAPDSTQQDLRAINDILIMTQAMCFKLQDQRYARDFVADLGAFQFTLVLMKSHLEMVEIGKPSTQPTNTTDITLRWSEFRALYGRLVDDPKVDPEQVEEEEDEDNVAEVEGWQRVDDDDGDKHDQTRMAVSKRARAS